ncbi:hypothetical protein N7510_010498 [Penicillium lagena]|uniref:uncharacterized protein n=1 Tax=Penicillium lagena TaxID=94218 RepID=UPI0025400A77|nr:uncharacterized protein N7510_010498 [Penicillium lagena]KAJ5605344.1 hypothetical protein N7510_010498 [Penicillium lagena]
MDPQRLHEFFNSVAEVIGEDNVSRDPYSGGLQGPSGSTAYGDPFASSTNHDPSGATRPKNVEEVREIVRLANRFLVALWTVSRGKNLGYGGSAPVVKGTVVLDLHRMDKILEINEEYGYAIVEPGVSFFDLYEEIQKQGLNLWPSVPAIGWGSVLGNTTDRGFGYTPLGDHAQAQCGLEVVLPSGELLRTGMGAMEGSQLFALYKGGFGPSVDGIFFQSNLVTKLGIQMIPAPEAYATVEVEVPKESDLVPLVGILSDLMRRSVILNSPSIANLFRIALTSRVPEVQQRLQGYMKPNSCVPSDVLEEIRAEQKWGFWRAYFSLYSQVEMLPGLLQATQRAFSSILGVTIKWRKFDGAPGQPLTTALIKEEERRPGSHIDYSPLFLPSGRELYEWYLKAKQQTIDAKFDFFADFHVFPRHVIGIELVIYTADEAKEVDQLMRHVLHDAAEMGYTAYRTHVDYMDEVASHFNFNGGALRRFTTMLKNFLDPNGILSPGKSGIWPSGGLSVKRSLGCR